MPSSPTPSWNCADPIAQLRELFVGIAQASRIRNGQNPARRPVFVKPHGIAHGTFEIVPGLPDHLRIGVFARERYECWVRFASDTQPLNPDLGTTLGASIKLFGVQGPKFVGDGNTHDFLLQNHDVFFVNTARDFCEFTTAGVVHGDYKPYLAKHPDTQRILDEMKKVEGSVATTTYWSVLPYALGQRFVKYKLEPESPTPRVAPSDEPDYLATELAVRLRREPVRMRFLVQLQTDPETMPLDRAMVRWSEERSVPVHVATLVLPRQDVDALGQAAYGENLAFNPWHALPEHEPQGSISAARRVVYDASATLRRDANGVPRREPDTARPSEVLPPLDDQRIVKAAIYPSIGIARVGNSASEYFIGPEVRDPLVGPPAEYRDAAGALKRQAARFRIYGLNANGVPVRELTADHAEIEWQVHLANQKAAWFQFQLALDIPEAASAQVSLLRNAAVADRRRLVIDGGYRRLAGRSPARRGDAHDNGQAASGDEPAACFDGGCFHDRPVYLGELRTDDAGRLIVLGGHGAAASIDGSRAVTFANNDGWHDDIADGPVTATVRLDGVTLPVAPAWVVVAPPNYAPAQKSVRTMWDLLRDVAIGAGQLPRPTRPSFTEDIAPIFRRLAELQWVNAGFAAAFGWQGPFELSSPSSLRILNDPGPETRERRRFLANQFRRFDRDGVSPTPWPWLYGDAMNIPLAATPRTYSTLTATQLRFLDQWAEGDFEADYDAEATPRRSLEELPIAQQADELTRAALEHCLADAFHPGCEMTWIMRTPTLYMAPFRLAHASPTVPEPPYTSILDALPLPDGPLGPQRAGGITRWMAVPWQTDTASCRSGYTAEYDPYLPTFWPARVPNQVLTEENYAIVMDRSRPLAERTAAFAERAVWTRTLGTGTYTDQINFMIAKFGSMGVVAERPGPHGDPFFPARMQVEGQTWPAETGLPRGVHHEGDSAVRAPAIAHGIASGGGVPHSDAAHSTRLDLATTDKANRFPRGLESRA